jgi:AcrR family transcriptional regulator
VADTEQPVRRRLPADKRREQILAKSKSVFLKHGLARTRVRDLADAAGVNSALLYHYFDSKEAIFEAAVLQPLEAAIQRTAEQAIPQFDATGEVMRAQTEAFIRDMLVAMQEVAPLLGLAMFGDAADGQRYFRERIEPQLERVRQVARRNLEVWAHREYNPDLAVDTIIGLTFFRALEDRFLKRKPADPATVASDLTSMLFDGMAAP